MIKTNPSLDTMEKYYEYYHEQIKKISEMIDQRATQEQMREQIQIIEKRVVTTLVPMDELIKKAKALQDADPGYIG